MADRIGIADQVDAPFFDQPTRVKQEKVQWKLEIVEQRALFLADVGQDQRIETADALAQQPLQHLGRLSEQDDFRIVGDDATSGRGNDYLGFSHYQIRLCRTIKCTCRAGPAKGREVLDSLH